MEERLLDLLRATGPLTGAEARDALGGPSFALYRACLRSPELIVRRVGRRYLRLDTRVDGYARLSPSILREFLTYTVVGLAGDQAAVERRATELEVHIHEVSRAKLDLARRVVDEAVARVTDVGHDPLGEANPERRFCALVAGDVVYGMAHDVPRPERSTGTLVQGSDLDLVVLLEDEAPEALVSALDRAMYERKYRYLVNPAFREEIDYVVKRFGRLVEQAAFDEFTSMVACKIVDEAVLLRGSAPLFEAATALLREHGVRERLRAMESAAIRSRVDAERVLLATDEPDLPADSLYLFYTDMESDEFE